MADKPANLTYGVDDRPGLWTTFLLGLQHVLPMSSTLMLPVLIVAAMPGATAADSQNFLRVSILAGGLSTIVTAMRWRWFGAGYLCPSLCGPAYLPASLAAASQGGLSLFFGMTTLSGLIKAALAPLARWLRPLFPPEVTGLLIMMIVIALISSGITQLFGIGLSGRGDMQATEVTIEGVVVGRALFTPQGEAGRLAEPAASSAAGARPPVVGAACRGDCRRHSGMAADATRDAASRCADHAISGAGNNRLQRGRPCAPTAGGRP